MSEQQQINPIVQVRGQLDAMGPELLKALPKHIPVERFQRVVMTAIQNNPDLLGVDRRSLFNAAMRAAQDGLLPDGRDGAIVKYKNDAQWMPMVGGILKKIRNSGEIATITARVVYDGDTFRYWVDEDGEHVLYEPCDAPNTSKILRVFAMAKTKDGELFVEPMTLDEVEQVRNVSRAKNLGPWTQWWGEMAKKTALRRLAKRLPMSSDLDDLIRRDDALYDFDGRKEARDVTPASKSTNARLSEIAAASGPAPAVEDKSQTIESNVGGDDYQGETIDAQPQHEAEPETQDQPQEAEQPKQQATGDRTPESRGRKAFANGQPDTAVPSDLKHDEAAVAAWLGGWKAAQAEANQQ